ncbi:MAG: LysM peptidoglycan-binding domain-containing protein [Verrucomicrobiae bacterium]|nr:LysM peptidoglycan-binding domain-containing protein [Verrucomicrobiae bacterium]
MKHVPLPSLLVLTAFLLAGCAGGPPKDPAPEKTAAAEPLPTNLDTTPPPAPAKKKPATAPAETQPEQVIPAKPVEEIVVTTITYTVVSGDSLWKIARKHNTSVSKIKELNSLTSEKLKPGQTLTVPSKQ